MENSTRSTIVKYIIEILAIVAASMLSALGLHIFVIPAGFAPMGVDGIATMAQEVFHINMGYISLAINLPLLLFAWFKLNKKYVIYTLAFSVITSFLLVVMERLNMYQYVSEHNSWAAVVAAGILLGLRTGTMLRIGGATGGADIVGCIIQKEHPYMNVETIISGVCYIVIGLSYFVYRNVDAIIMAIAQMIIFNFTVRNVLRPTRNAVEVKIVTDSPEQFKKDILYELKHGATTVSCKGLYTDIEKTMIVTIINIRQLNDLVKISKRYPESFIYYNDVDGVWGNFRWNRSDPAN